jgi:signal transduction histidine kinase/ActR/RegA family two-component response regulator
MKPRSEELVQFISRTFLAAVLAITVGLGVLATLFYQRNNDEWWARHGREGSRLAREIQLSALRRALGVADPRVAAKLDSLRRLAQGLPDQEARAARIAAAFAQWDSTSMPVALGQEVSAFLRAEDDLYDQRTAAAHRLDRVFIVSTILAIILLLVTLYLIRRRLLQQANELQAGESRFRTLVESLHPVVFTLGRDMKYDGMFGGQTADNVDTYRQFIGKTPMDILGPDRAQVHMDAAHRALRGETVTYDWSIEGGNTTMHYTNTVSPLRASSGEIHGVVGINRDVTEQVTRDRALTAAREQLRQAQRLDALGQLAGGVAHDFNNLLTVIMTYAAILEEEAAPGSDTARSVEEIRLASERAAALTRQLLAFGRRQMLQPRAIDLNETVRDVERMLRRLLPPDIRFETTLSPGPAMVMADPGQVEQVLINVAINARDAMPDGGALTITTANVDGPAEASGMTEPHVVVTVADTGVGMKPETKARVFEPFFTTKGVGKGTGLGLATVHGIVEQSGGRISLESEPGRGTTFMIRLPRHVASPAAPAPSTIPGGRSLGGSETILLVDDNEELRRVVKRMLSRAGYHVVEAANGAAALAHLDRGGRVDLVLTDVMMPEMNGRAVMDAIRQRHRDVRLLLMSGYNYDTALRGMAQRGDVAFVEKPFTAEKLLHRLREVLEPSQDRGAA